VARALRTGFPRAKMTGGGAGGVVAVLARSEDRAAFESLAREFAAESGASPYLFEGSSAGATEILDSKRPNPECRFGTQSRMTHWKGEASRLGRHGRW